MYKRKICVLLVDHQYDWDNTQTFSMILPELCWKEVTQEEESVYRRYVALKNKKLKTSDYSYQVLVYLPDEEITLDIDFEKAREELEAEAAKAAAEKAKRERSASKSKLTKEIKKVEKQIETLLDPTLGYTEDSDEILKLRKKIAELMSKKIKLSKTA